MRSLLVVCTALACGGAAAAQDRIDPQLAAAISQIKAIDNHAHPVVPGGKDTDFDALPVDVMEPSSDPVGVRERNPSFARAARALFGDSAKEQIKSQQGDAYPAWVLDKVGIDIMLANRVAMAGGIVPPRFRWVPYEDALLFPLDNSRLAAQSPDRKTFFADEDRLLRRYFEECGMKSRPSKFSDYLSNVVTPTLERQKKGGAIAVKFEAAYLRSLDFGNPSRSEADRVYSSARPSNEEYKKLQDYLFRYIAAECGRLGMAVHLHTAAGAGGYFDVAGANPLLLQPLLNDPTLRKTAFVMIHGGWPFTREITALLTKPNAYLDFSEQTLITSPHSVAQAIRAWLEYVPEKVMFATDAYPYSTELDWEESAWIAARNGRDALAIALTAMLDAGEITHDRAMELARMVLRGNARKLYGL